MVKGCLFWVCGMFSIRGTSIGNILPPSLFCLIRYQMCLYTRMAATAGRDENDTKWSIFFVSFLLFFF